MSCANPIAVSEKRCGLLQRWHLECSDRTGDDGKFMARILIVDDSPSQLVGLKRIVE
jgi:hypothetical protein